MVGGIARRMMSNKYYYVEQVSSVLTIDMTHEIMINIILLYIFEIFEADPG